MGRISDTARESDDHVLHQFIYIHVVNMFLPAALSFGTLVYERGDYPTSRLPLTIVISGTCINPVNAVIANPPAGKKQSSSKFFLSMIGIFN